MKRRLLITKASVEEQRALSGGAMNLGESIRQTVSREVKEETGFEVEPLYLAGVYSDPEHVIAFTDGEVRQQFSICF